MAEISTSKLLQRLFKTKNIKNAIRQNADEMECVPFSVHINQLCSDRNTVPERIIKKSGIERTYGHKLFNGTRQPSRDKVIQLAFGFELSLDETQELLKIARRSTLYPRIERDAVFICAINNNFDIDNVQITLYDLGLPMLGKVEIDD